MQHVQRDQQIQHRQPMPGGRRFKSCPRYHHRPGPVRGRVSSYLGGPGGHVWCGYPSARSVRGGHEGINGDVETCRGGEQVFCCPLGLAVESVGDVRASNAKECSQVSARKPVCKKVLRDGHPDSLIHVH